MKTPSTSRPRSPNVSCLATFKLLSPVTNGSFTQAWILQSYLTRSCLPLTLQPHAGIMAPNLALRRRLLRVSLPETMILTTTILERNPGLRLSSGSRLRTTRKKMAKSNRGGATGRRKKTDQDSWEWPYKCITAHKTASNG